MGDCARYSTLTRGARYEAEGTPDAGFGSGGSVTVDFYGAAYDLLNAVAVQPDGKILVAGSATNGANMLLALIRVLP